MDAATSQAWIAAGVGLIGAAVGGAAAVFGQLLAARHERKLADDAWARKRRQWSFDQEVATYLGLLAQLREFDRYHGKLISTSNNQEAREIPRPHLDDPDVDRVNAFASDAIRDDVNRAMKANTEIRDLLASSRRNEFAGQDPGTIVKQPYSEFREAHGKIVERVRSFLRSDIS
jgi:hypothetical protein